MISKVKDFNPSLNDYDKCYQLLGEILYMFFDELDVESVKNLVGNTYILEDVMMLMNNNVTQENKRFMILVIRCLVNKSIEISHILSSSKNILPYIFNELIKSNNCILNKLGINLINFFLKSTEFNLTQVIYGEIRKEGIILYLIENLMTKMKDFCIIREIIQIIFSSVKIGRQISNKNKKEIIFKELSQSKLMDLLGNIKNLYNDDVKIMQEVEYIEDILKQYL